MVQVARDLASLALEREKQGGHLRVRQREQLRRAFAKAAEFQQWNALVANSAEPVENAAKDVAKLARSGIRSLRRDLANEMTSKQTEMSRLERVADSMVELAEHGDFDEPVEITYSHTARSGTQGLITKTQTLELTNAGEARDAAQTIEKKMEAWDGLREQMLADLEQRQQQIDELKSSVPAFVESSKGLLREVFATLS